MSRYSVCQFCAAAILLATSARLGQAAPPVVPIVAAVVGFRVHNAGADPRSNVAAYRYETWLIVRDASGLHVVAKLNDIIVPRKTGFWRIGVQPTCQFSPPQREDPDDHGNISTEDIAYAVPIAQVPVLSVRGAPCNTNTAERIFSPSYDPNAVERDENDPTQCGNQTAWLEGVLPDLLSMGEHYGQSEECEPRGFHFYDDYWVQSPDKSFAADSPDKVTLANVLGSAADRAWDEAIRADFRREEGDDGGCGNLELSNASSDITDWYFAHSGGAWEAFGFIQMGNGGCQLGGALGLNLPQKWTGEPPPPPWLTRALTTHLRPNTIADAWISPDGTLVVKQLSEASPGTSAYGVREAALFSAASGQLGPQLLSLPAQEIVMVQWATGRFVDQWVEALRKVGAEGLPAVVIKSPSQGRNSSNAKH